MTLTFHPYDPGVVATLRAGGGDAYDLPAERALSDGAGNPCRSCLRNIPEGAPMLICAARPFPTLQPYAETGPIFLCAEACTPFAGPGLPPVLRNSPDYLVKGYSADHRIRYGSGRITPAVEVEPYCEALLADTAIAFVDIRSARNNCFLMRVTRGVAA